MGEGALTADAAVVFGLEFGANDLALDFFVIISGGERTSDGAGGKER